jgi:hypothetical protein
MRITEARLRSLIREMLTNEMAYAGHLGVKRGAPSYGPGNLDTDIDKEEMMTRAEKFAKSAYFDDQAVKLFGNIPIPVWYAAIIGGVGAGMNLTDAPKDYVYPAQKHFERMMISDRVGLADTFPEGIEALESAGFENLDGINPKDLVIIGVASMVYPGFNSTPWMTLHAVFDADYTESFFDSMCPSYTRLYSIMSGDSLEPIEGHSPAEFLHFFGSTTAKPRTPSPFTMGVARRGGVNGRDALAECMVQELLDRRGLHLNWDAVPEELHPLAELVIRDIKAAAAEFRQSMQGKTLVAIVN